MGLDMYLEKKNYIGNNYVDKKSKMVKVVVPKNQDGKIFPVGEIKNERVTYITEQIGYWRKANAIHNFFTSIKDQHESCESIEVTKDMLGMLLDRCTMVLEDRSRADELLPTTSGFFFGSTEYDEWYFKKLEDTINQL